ncbi:SDR family oxidoreductase [Cyanothece sp. BG0011]|uniref:SDR family oxidoreductase n=1 Tax=Cyanothece sp. BG0011 TaxID=2082950 RepID=UPI000D1FB580|nr:SDR family oxidoreductase [Cyanothece sp. BG0011]
MDSSSSQLNAIITGASSGIGKAVSLAFAQAGVNVALVSRSLESLETVAQACTQEGVKAKPYVMDLTELTKIPAKIQDIVKDFGNIDIIVNNAGMGYTNLLGETPLADWQQVINLNLTSVFQCVQGVLPQMRERKKGTIINVASVAATQVFPEWGAYSVSKAALVSFSKVLAAEERRHGIRVVTISPGPVNTSIWDTDTVQADFDRNAMLTPDVVAQTILQAALLPAEAVIEDLTILPSAGTL